MDEKSSEEEILNVIYKNAHIGLQSISDILPETEDEDMKRELTEEYEVYEEFIGRLRAYMREKKVEPKEIGPFKKAMIFTGVKVDTLRDDSRSHVAEMMIKGTVMGITEIGALLSANIGAPIEVKNFAEELKTLEEKYEKRLKRLL
ncbi:MAG: hypothetical protein IJ800_06255 [Clostridia bacterium]|nr:hypothetical protein [Clostridia bacterium]